MMVKLKHLEILKIEVAKTRIKRPQVDKLVSTFVIYCTIYTIVHSVFVTCDYYTSFSDLNEIFE